MSSFEDSQRYHSVLGEVYHIMEDCPRGRLIPGDFRRQGSGGLPLCPACRDRVEAEQQRVAKERMKDAKLSQP